MKFQLRDIFSMGAKSIAGSVFPSKISALKILKAIFVFFPYSWGNFLCESAKKIFLKYVGTYFSHFTNRKFKNKVFLKPFFFFIRQNVPIFLMQILKEDYGLN